MEAGIANSFIPGKSNDEADIETRIACYMHRAYPPSSYTLPTLDRSRLSHIIDAGYFTLGQAVDYEN